MTRKIFLCVLLGLGCFLLPACAEENGSDRQGIVSWVYDGDTIEVSPAGKVRLIGIDTPERQASRRDQYFIERGISAERLRAIYHEAKQHNIRQVKGQKVTLKTDGDLRDRHGRLLAYVLLPDGRNLNRILIEKGLAVVYRKFSFSEKEDFLLAEEQARSNQVGLWANQPP